MTADEAVIRRGRHRDVIRGSFDLCLLAEADNVDVVED